MSLAMAEDVMGGFEAPVRKVPEPNFFLVGAAKSGSTSLAEYLRQHPDVFMPGGEDFAMKEPMHFCDPIPPWQEKYRDFNTYLSLFADAGDCKAIGEGSVAYLAWPGAETRIHNRYPDARIIIVLQKPGRPRVLLVQLPVSAGHGAGPVARARAGRRGETGGGPGVVARELVPGTARCSTSGSGTTPTISSGSSAVFRGNRSTSCCRRT